MRRKTRQGIQIFLRTDAFSPFIVKVSIVAAEGCSFPLPVQDLSCPVVRKIRTREQAVELHHVRLHPSAYSPLMPLSLALSLVKEVAD